MALIALRSPTADRTAGAAGDFDALPGDGLSVGRERDLRYGLRRRETEPDPRRRVDRNPVRSENTDESVGTSTSERSTT